MKRVPLVAVKFTSKEERAELESVLNMLGVDLEQFVNIAVNEKLQTMSRRAEKLYQEYLVAERAKSEVSGKVSSADSDGASGS